MRKIISIIPLELTNIEESGFHLMLNAKVGRKKIRLLVDTGASKTVFDKTRLSNILGNKNQEFESIEQLSTGLGTNDMESHIAELKSIKIGDIRIKNFEVVVLDLSHVNVSYEMIGDKGIDGVLGSDLLEKYKAVIYFSPPRLKLYY
jgi:predicted aspartyl protease